MNLRASAASVGLVSSETSGPAAFWKAVKEFAVVRRLSRMKRGVQTAAQIIEAFNDGGRYRAAFVTLTYRPDATYRKRQVADFLKCVRRWCQRRGYACRYVWVMELTKRGVPHYHVMIWIPRGERLPKPDRAGWWPYGATQIQWARSPVGYLVKYASKGDSGCALPRGARLFGCGGLTAHERQTKSWRLLPLYVRREFERDDKPMRAKGGGWLSPVTGAWLPAWRLIFQDGCIKAIPPEESYVTS